jgi:glycosyltransferase involved in cell wall biosynthesis
MIRLIDLNYYYHSDISDPREVIRLHWPSIGYADFIKDKLSIQMIRHMNFEGEKNREGVNYRFFRSKNKFFHIPFRTHRFIKKCRPDIVLIQGFIFPVQIIALKWTLGKHVKIMVQHRGGTPFTGIKKIFQRLADKYISTYLFTGTNNAQDWISAGIISNPEKCRDLLAASTGFSRLNKLQCQSEIGIDGEKNFLWVGRLITGKDPLTVLSAFEQYLPYYPQARLIMIYQTEELLPEIKMKLDHNGALKNSVCLMGSIPHERLQQWYSAADYYISGSHKESCGFTLLEAMACGCIPVVPHIPSFQEITENGKFGLLFEAGSVPSLLKKLLDLQQLNKNQMSRSVEKHFNNALSFHAIAGNLFSICGKLTKQ